MGTTTRVPKLMAIAATPGGPPGYTVLYGLDTEGRAWCRVMEPESVWRRVPEAADPRDR